MKQRRPDTEKHMAADMGKGFAHFVDEVLRGRNNKTILNGSVALSALDVGVPAAGGLLPFDIPAMLSNNRELYNPSGWGSGLTTGAHPLFDFSSENFTLFGLDFPDMMAQIKGLPSEHHTPLYDGEFGQSFAESLGLADLPYMEMAHFAHLGMALYDTGRTFCDVWRETADYYKANNTNPLEQGLALAGHLGKAITHPDMLHTLAARAAMLTVMGLLHPLGGVIAIGVAYLAAHLVHSFFGLLEHNKEAICHIKEVPLLGAIYNASGIKEWAERDLPKTDSPASDAERIDPYQELELTPERDVRAAKTDGRLHELAPEMQAQPA